MKKWQDWFYGLTQREQVCLVGGTVIAVVLLIYACIWSPLNSGVNTMRQQIDKNQQLLVWMTHAKARLATFGNQQQQQSVSNVMVTAEKTLAEANLAKYLRKVTQPEPKQVTIDFQAVPFDQLMAWLQPLVHDYRIKVKGLKVTKAPQFGTVEALLTLES